jgi:predicted nucleic acid-binding protein
VSAGYLLDTNVVSELTKGSRANAAVIDWFTRTGDQHMHVSVITLGEIAKGIALAEDAGRDMRVQRTFLERLLPERFGERILPFDAKAALIWGRMLKKLGGNREAERSLAIDAQIAATAQASGLVVCTRNVRDFTRLVADGLINPFEA